ncbi:SIMPL domain-containing protein, partial [Patescibacteria group bacterium]|nr:SIMPL domain-containing protein [Patescibacteria group bacterium]
IFLAVIFGVFIITWINSPLVVTVTGTGELSVPATSATVSFTVSASDASPQGAMDQVKTKASNLRRVLQSTGIEEKEIMESQVTAVPAAAYVAGATGYQASITMGAKSLNVAGVDALVSQLYSNGAIVVAQPVLSADKQSELEAQAMNEAMADAKKQANDLAKKNLKLIKKIVLITQASSASTATVTSKTESLGNEFKIAKAVQVSYKMW